MKYEVEGWNKWEYPSHWDFEESFDSLEEAIDWIMLQDYPDNYRVIQELPMSTGVNCCAHAGSDGAIRAHFKKMQDMCRDYLMPETYVRRFPDQPNRYHTELAMPDPLHSEVQKSIMNTRRDRAFISDIIRMLDGPEQREAEAALRGGK